MEEDNNEPLRLSCSKDGSILDLPWEVLQEIFVHLDGKSLVICKRVCKIWKEHVNYLEKKGTFWYDICQNEIPKWVQFDILDNIFPAHWSNQNSVDWQVIYKCWDDWKTLEDLPYSVKEFVSGLKGMSSIKVSGEWLLMSTCEGKGKLVGKNFSTDVCLDIYIGGSIVDFELVNADQRNSSNSRQPRVEVGTFFNTIAHNEIWIEQKNSYGILGKTCCAFRDKVQQRIRHSYGYRATLQTRNNPVIHLNKVCSEVPGPAIMEFELPQHYSEMLDFWANKICLSTAGLNGDRTVNVDTIVISPKSQNLANCSSANFSLKPPEHFNIYTWKGLPFLFNTSMRRVGFQAGNETIEYETPVRKGCVSCALFYCSHLFLGTDRGNLLIYKLDSPEDCLKIVPYETKSWNIEVAYGNIIHIAVAEPIHHGGKKPMIICATSEKVYTILF